jgi:hypothetical protein
MASLPGSPPLLQHSITPIEMLLDAVPLCFMLRRFSRPNRARGKGPVKMGPPQAGERASSRTGKVAANK